MDERVTWSHYGQRSQHALLSTLLLFLNSLLLGPSTAQSTIDASMTASLPDRISSLSVTSTSTITTPRTGLRGSLTTLLTSSSTPNSTTSSTSTMDDPPQGPSQLFPLADPADVNQQRNESVFNYYFLFLAAFGLLLVAGLWIIHKRRKKRKEQTRLSGQNALARDLDGWVNTRRWMHGAWRPAAGFARREEGFNEHGEAPPPYQPKSADTLVVQGPDGTSQGLTPGLTIPLRILSRDDVERSRLPGYEEASTPNIRPATATTHMPRGDTTDGHPNSSTRDLLRVQTNQSGGAPIP